MPNRPIGYRAKKPIPAVELVEQKVATTAATVPIDATDSARKLAAEYSINLADVVGSGVDGRITKSDVETAVVALAATNEPASDTGGAQ